MDMDTDTDMDTKNVSLARIHRIVCIKVYI
jgi:hypothetical protein